jgi:hypothetical protein
MFPELATVAGVAGGTSETNALIACGRLAAIIDM